MTRFRFTLRWVWVFAVGALLVGCGTLWPEPQPRRLLLPSREVLPNGMRLIVQEHRAAEAVVLQLWVAVGARDEAAGERGFSHFTEHMLFKGTATRPRGFVEQEVESIGGRTNAGTSYDYTFYYILVPARHAVRALEVLADMAFNSKFDPTELAHEREVVFEEVRLGEDNPRTSLFRGLYNLAFGGHPYGFAVLGDPNDLRAATQSTLRAYYKRHYVAGNMTLVVVGAVDPEQIRTAALRTFAAAPATGYRRPPMPPQPPIRGIRQEVVERTERQGSLALGWSAPPVGHPDMYAVDLLAHILGGSRTSRLNQALRERARIVSTVSAGYGALQGSGLMTVSAQFEPKDEAAVESGVLTEIKRVRDEGVTEGELARAVTASEAEHAFARETVEGLASAYGRAETIWTLEGDRQYLERLRAVTREQIQDAARRYLSESYARLVFVPKVKKS
jgi:zinc protease